MQHLQSSWVLCPAHFPLGEAHEVTGNNRSLSTPVLRACAMLAREKRQEERSQKGNSAELTQEYSQLAWSQFPWNPEFPHPPEEQGRPQGPGALTLPHFHDNLHGACLADPSLPVLQAIQRAVGSGCKRREGMLGSS